MPVLVFLLIFGIYLLNLFSSATAETVRWIAAGGSLDPAAGPAAILGRLAMTIVPFGNPAYRFHVLGAVVSAGGVLVVAAALRRFLPPAQTSADLLAGMERARWDETGVWITAVLWGLRPGLWHSSLSAHPAVFGAVVLWSSLLWFYRGEGRAAGRVSPWAGAALTALLVGLALPVHPALFGAVPGLLIYPWIFPSSTSRDRGGRFPGPTALRSGPLAWVKAPTAASGFFFLGLLPAVWGLVGRAALDSGPSGSHPSAVLGLIGQWRSFQDFWQARASWFSLDPQQRYFSALADNVGIVGLALCAAGIVLVARQAPRLLAWLSALWLFTGPLAAQALAFWPPNHLERALPGVVVLSLVGPFILVGWALRHLGARKVLARWAVAALIPASLGAGIPWTERANMDFRNLGKNILASVPAGAVLWNPTPEAENALFYEKFQGHRPDVLVWKDNEAEQRGARRAQRAINRVLGREPGRSPATASNRQTILGVLSSPWATPVFSDAPERLPGAAKARDWPLAIQFPEDVLPQGIVYRYFPAEVFRMADPLSHLSLARLTFWWYRGAFPSAGLGQGPRSPGMRERYAKAHIRMADKFAQYQIQDLAQLESYLALLMDPRPGNQAYDTLGVLAYQSRDTAKAAFFFERAAAGRPRDPNPRLWLGRARSVEGREEEALTAFQEALRRDPGQDEARTHVADILEGRGRHEEALAQWKMLRDGHPNQREYVWRLAQSYYRLGRFEKAREALKEYQLFPLSPDERTRADAFSALLPSSSEESR
jgi:Tfp pilus assembly protein PilF